MRPESARHFLNLILPAESELLHGCAGSELSNWSILVFDVAMGERGDRASLWWSSSRDDCSQFNVVYCVRQKYHDSKKISSYTPPIQILLGNDTPRTGRGPGSWSQRDWRRQTVWLWVSWQEPLGLATSLCGHIVNTTTTSTDQPLHRVLRCCF